MEYEVFKEEVLKRLQEICGGNVQIKTGEILKNNGKHYDAIQIFTDGADGKVCPAIPLQWLYDAHCNGDIGSAECAEAVYEMHEGHRDMGGASEMMRMAMDWEQVQASIYPILLSAKDNQELLGRIVSRPMLDLSVAYIFRGKINSRYAGIKITCQMLESYGVSAGELHKQALRNLAGDSYRFHDMKRFIVERIYGEAHEKNQQEEGKDDEFYIFTNGALFYGAAGILDKERVRGFANGQDFYILPASIHETIFVPADGGKDAAFYNGIVKSVNEEKLDIEERLSDHVYFYDAGTDEIRMCV